MLSTEWHCWIWCLKHVTGLSMRLELHCSYGFKGVRSDTSTRSHNVTLCSKNLHVQMSKATGSWQCQFDHSFSIDGVAVQVVEQRAVFVVVRHQPQLGPSAIIWASRKTVAATLLKNGDLSNTDINDTNKYAKNDKWDALFGTFVVSSYKTQDVFMAEHDCLIDFCFPEPGSLLPGREDLHSYITTPPTSTPHLSKTTFTDNFLEDNCSGHSSLDKQRQACSKKDDNRKQSPHHNHLQNKTILLFYFASVHWPEPEPEVDRLYMRSCRDRSLAG